MSGTPPVLEPNLALLRQGIALLGELTDPMFLRRRGEWSPVASHYRHVIEHYQAFLSGLPDGRVNYDDRARDSRLEASRAGSLEATRSCLRGFEALEPLVERALLVHMEGGDDAAPPDWRDSSIGRELQFLASHTVHHFALIRVLLDESGLVLPADFGIAPSTLAYRRAAH